jgi:DNA invertase Pin-like site-specific DNA recombinase
MSKVIGYIRVSSVDQNTERQLDGIHLDSIFEEKVSGATRERPQLEEMLRNLREGDLVVVHDISRLARNLGDLKNIIDEILAKDASVKFIKESLEFAGGDSPMQKLMLNLLGSFYEFEREMIRERQREGIAKAKERGVYKGRKPSVDGEAIRIELEAGTSIRKTAEKLKVAASTVQRIKKALC